MYVVYGEGIHIHTHLGLEGNAGCPLPRLSYDREAGPEPGPATDGQEDPANLPVSSIHTHWVIGVCDFLCGCWEFKSGSHAFG